MSELLWTCDRGALFSSEMNGLHLEVSRSSSGDGFRYLLRRHAGEPQPVSVASGYRSDLRDAIAAAERTAKSFNTRRAHAEA
jgi:hypothetical protein